MTAEPFVLLHEPPQQVVIDAVEGEDQLRRTVPTVVIDPPPHDRVNLTCQVLKGRATALVQPPGPNLPAETLGSVIADSRVEAEEVTPRLRPGLAHTEPVPQERERGVLS